MKGVLLATFAIGIWVPIFSQQSRQPVEGIVDGNRTASADKTQKTKQNQQTTETEAMRGMLAQVTQIQQARAQELKDIENQKNEDAKISGKIKTYTFCLVVVGFIQALILAATVCAIARQTAATNNSERAWITVSIDKLPDFPNDPNAVAFLWIKPSVKNSGRTPARITKMVLRSHEVNPSNGMIPGILPPDPTFPSDQTTLLEGRDIVLPPNDAGQPLGIAITPERFNDARIGNKTLYVYGYVEYRDTVANKPHETRFCYIYWPQSGFSPDPSGFYLAGVTPKKYIGAT